MDSHEYVMDVHTNGDRDLRSRETKPDRDSWGPMLMLPISAGVSNYEACENEGGSLQTTIAVDKQVKDLDQQTYG